MKKLLFCYLLIITSSFAIAQYSKEEKLEQLKSRNDIKVTESNVYGEKDILKLEYPDGKVIYKNIADYRYPENDIHKPEYSPTYDSTIIDLTTIDTTLYYQKYKFWQEVLISNRKFPIIGDVNGNGRVELYGFEKDYRSDWFEFKFLQKHHFVNDKLEFIDKDGNVVDMDGKPIEVTTPSQVETDKEPEFLPD